MKRPTLFGSVDLSNEYKKAVCLQSYIGKKGYTIPKSILSKEDEEFLRKDLFVKPQTFSAGYGAESQAFPVFRENANKFYLPRFYGIERYGEPSRTEIQSGDEICLNFPKELRDYQNDIIKVYMDYISKQNQGAILEVPCGRGKCLGKDTPILMYDGTIKLVQDVMIGDLLMGDDSTPRTVLSLARGKEMMYKVNTKEGEGYIVNESHILSLKYGRHNAEDDILDISVVEYLTLPQSRKDDLLGYRVPVTFETSSFQIHPYLVGYWLGDHFDINSLDTTNISMDFFVENNMISKKHIPHHYKCNSRENQLYLLAGLIDSGGYYYDNCYEIKVQTEELLDDIIFLARSLGLVSYKNINIDDEKSKHYSTTISGEGLTEIPVKYCNRCTMTNSNVLTYKISLEQIDVDDYYGFEIDGNRRFVLGDFTVTHNTVMALKIISNLKKKTLILVHKEFLMNQWIERIEEFLPGARVGKIQGTVFNIDEKDIVIGMIQTLYDKEYPTETFSSFGFTIIDEVHRIGSEQFSRTLFKTITPYMLGISATVERKDKLARILYMFIGPKIYSENRDNEDSVCVRAITYCSNDNDFGEVEVDYRGNTKYSTMITKLCAFGPRSDFIIKVIGDLLEETENQIMILGHNRSLLTYLYEAINHKNLATVGYYIGGMKPEKLQETETKQIVLATYAMAAEALDIKTLATLIMVTPKTDIIQSVGRILRTKHEKTIIVDIVDQHEPFQNQWTQRKRFYKKCNYQILQIESKHYTGMEIDHSWKKVFEPKLSGEKCEKMELPKCLIDISMIS